MKILNYNKKRSSIRLVPENVDDLWLLYNIIRRGDYLFSRTTREIKFKEDGIRPTKGKRIVISLGIDVEKTSFQSDNYRLRANGIIMDAPEKYELRGSHHTINIYLNKPITVHKKEWLSYDYERIKRASQEQRNPIIVVSIDDENGCVAFLRQRGIDVKAEITARLPGKLEADRREAALAKYYSSILKELVLAWNDSHGLIAIIGPGFLKENFMKYFREKQPNIFKDVSAIKNVGTGGLAGIKEALRSRILDVVAKKMRVIEETRVVEDLLSHIATQQMAVTYGIEDVQKAISYGAVELLLVADILLRKANDEEGSNFEKFMVDVEKMGGKVMIICTEHEAGKKLLSLGGIAALLRFKIY